MTRTRRSRQPLADVNKDVTMKAGKKSNVVEETIKRRSSRSKTNDTKGVKQNENAVQTTGPIKKFFKNKEADKDVKPISVPITTKKTQSQQVKKQKKAGTVKKVQSPDSTFSPQTEKQKKSTKRPEKKLRPRGNKNYCEISKLSSSSKTTEEKPTDVENPVSEKDSKGIPIYKTLRLSQENKDTEGIFDFPDDSQEEAPKGKKRKKTVKRTVAKRVKKTITFHPVKLQKIQKKATKKVSPKVQLKKQNLEPAKVKERVNIEPFIESENVEPFIEPENVEPFREPENTEKSIDREKNVAAKSNNPKFQIPKHLQNAGDSTLEEASTIKIISDEKLQGSKTINLTATPPAPKSISELKLFGPKNVRTSQSTAQYSNMVNHSLIRKSMSPITKVAEKFDTGSPWRAADTFSRVQGVVQSTPHINRLLPSTREKKLPAHVANLKKKSISSEDTILLSPSNNNKLTDKQNVQVTSPEKSRAESPRKFGTVISNLSPIKSKPTACVNNCNSPVHNNLSSSRTASPQTCLPEAPAFEEISTIIVNKEKENTPTKRASPRTYSTPSPLKSERLRTSKRLESQSKSASQAGEAPEIQVGPSQSEKQNTSVLKQTNLNNFLNLNEVPESACITTPHGIFDDVHSTPICGKKPKQSVEEPNVDNVDNAFGFDDSSDFGEESGSADDTASPVMFKEKNKINSEKGNARSKSAVPTRLSTNTVKKTLSKGASKKKTVEKGLQVNLEEDKNDEKESENIKDNVQNDKEPGGKKAMLDAVSFLDTFDVLSENGEDIETKIPEEIPLFVDLEPPHFTKPPRRSYNKRKRVNFNTSPGNVNSDDEESAKKKPKKKKESKLCKEERKRMQDWVRSINDTFDEIEHYDLLVE